MAMSKDPPEQPLGDRFLREEELMPLGAWISKEGLS